MSGGYPGDIRSRSLVMANKQQVRLEKGKYHDFPPGYQTDGVTVITWLHQPTRYPIGCPQITREMMNSPDDPSPEYLSYGRAMFLMGLAEGTIPRNCTTRPFSSYLLGGIYSSQHCLEDNIPGRLVLIEEYSGRVKIIDRSSLKGKGGTLDENSDTEQDGDGKRFEEGLKSESLSERPLIQSVHGARLWDQKAADKRPLQPTGPVRSIHGNLRQLSICSTDTTYVQQKNPSFADCAKEPERPVFGSFAFEAMALSDAAAVPQEPPAKAKTAPKMKAAAKSQPPERRKFAPPPPRRPRNLRLDQPRATSCHTSRSIAQYQGHDRTIMETKRPMAAGDIEVFGTKELYVVAGDGPAPPGLDREPEVIMNCRDDALWQVLTKQRYDLMKSILKSGRPIQFRSSGKSLEPLVYSGDLCFLWPVRPPAGPADTSCTSIQPGDIVFCAVQPNSRYYVHLVWAKGLWHNPEDGTVQEYFTIGNNKKNDRRRQNGWVYWEHIFGILVKTQRGVYNRNEA